MRTTYSIFFVFVISLSFSLNAASVLYVEREASAALSARDEYFARTGLTSFFFPFRPEASACIESLSVKFQTIEPDTAVPWYDFSYGVANLKNDQDSASLYFNRALDAAGNDIGEVFVLSLEFGRITQLQWEQKSLERLKKILLMQGAQSAPLISRTMLYKAILADQKGDPSSATLYYKWAMTFDRFALLPKVRNILRDFPTQPAFALEESAALARLISESWRIQLRVVLAVFLWVRSAAIFFIVGIFIILGLTYGSLALHGISDRFPKALPHKLRTYCSCLPLLSIISLGMLPFLWIFSCLLWRHCGKKGVVALAACCIALVVYPISVKIEDMMRRGLSSESSLMLFSESVEEGYSADRDEAIRKNAMRRENDYLAHVAAAVFASKKNDMGFALASIQKARALRADDPVVLLTEGNVNFLNGTFEKAKTAYESCMKLFPSYNPAVFNCGQYYLGTIETIKGMDCMDRATKLDPLRTNAFIKTNDECFSKKWPRLRQLMAPEYEPIYFWGNVFPLYWDSWSSANALWGTAFLGLPIVGYFLFSILLLAALIAAHFFVWSGDKPKQSNACKLCGAAICRQCKRGLVCAECYESLQQIRNENIRQRIIEKIILKSKRLKRCISFWIDALFPGAGMVFYSRGKNISGAMLMLLTSLMYAALISVSPLSDLPFYYAPVAAYVVIFLARAIITTAKEYGSKGESYGA